MRISLTITRILTAILIYLTLLACSFIAAQKTVLLVAYVAVITVGIADAIRRKTMPFVSAGFSATLGFGLILLSPSFRDLDVIALAIGLALIVAALTMGSLLLLLKRASSRQSG